MAGAGPTVVVWNRRRFLLTSLAGALAAPLGAGAQQAAKMYRVGLLHVGLDHVPPSLDGLRDGLRALGYEGARIHALILRLASARHLPVAGHRKEWVQQGALFSYAENIREVGRVAASRYVDKLLKGAKPANLPVEGYERPELVINLKTARALGLTIPPLLLARADQVIE